MSRKRISPFSQKSAETTLPSLILIFYTLSITVSFAVACTKREHAQSLHLADFCCWCSIQLIGSLFRLLGRHSDSSLCGRCGKKEEGIINSSRSHVHCHVGKGTATTSFWLLSCSFLAKPCWVHTLKRGDSVIKSLFLPSWPFHQHLLTVFHNLLGQDKGLTLLICSLTCFCYWKSRYYSQLTVFCPLFITSDCWGGRVWLYV